jgi:hypothetical protein
VAAHEGVSVIDDASPRVRVCGATSDSGQDRQLCARTCLNSEDFETRKEGRSDTCETGSSAVFRAVSGWRANARARIFGGRCTEVHSRSMKVSSEGVGGKAVNVPSETCEELRGQSESPNPSRSDVDGSFEKRRLGAGGGNNSYNNMTTT